MKINVIVPHSLEIPALSQKWELNLGKREVIRAMQLADELGYHKALLSEHFLIPQAHTQLSGSFYHHATVGLAAVAGATERLGLASSINILPLQHAVVQAKAWSTLDWFSGGRASAVVAVGWLKGEFDLLGVPFHERGRMCDEYVEAMIALWTEESPVFEGQYVSFRDVAFAPKPVNGKIPLWFGGDSEGPFRRIAKWGDGWSPFTTPPEKFPEVLDFIKSHTEYDGREIGLCFPIESMRLSDGHVETSRQGTYGSWNAQEMVDLCGWLENLGVTESTIPLPPLESFEAYLERLHWVAEEIMPKVTHER
jgi:probable F420-dependent oxidoreductase